MGGGGGEENVGGGGGEENVGGGGRRVNVTIEAWCVCVCVSCVCVCVCVCVCDMRGFMEFKRACVYMRMCPVSISCSDAFIFIQGLQMRVCPNLIRHAYPKKR